MAAKALTSKSLKTNNLGGFMEVKVGQVWKHAYTQRLWRVIFVGKYEATIADEEGSFSEALWKFEKGIFTLESSPPELSDLEVVQKALLKVECSLDIDRRGGWWVVDGKGMNNNYRYSGKSMESLLTWAKQTIGAE